MTAVSDRVLFERYLAVAGPSESVTSTLSRRGSLWVPGPDEINSIETQDLARAVAGLAAAEFAPGSVLRIDTGGLVAPAELLPALTGWVTSVDHERVDLAEWSSDDERAGWSWEEIAGGYVDSEARMALDRFITVDDQPCPVFSDGDTRAAIALDGDDYPEFEVPWVSFRMHNGYGWGHHARGLVSRGVHCELVDFEWMKSVRLSLHRGDEKDELLDVLMAWADGIFRHVPGHNGTQLQVNEHGKFFVDDVEIIDVNGGFAPALWASRSADPVL